MEKSERRKPRRGQHGRKSPGREESKPAKQSRIAGFAAVTALFEQRAGSVERLFVDERAAAEAEDFCDYMADVRKPFRIVPSEELARVAGTPMHGGIVAVAAEKEVLPLDMAAAAAWAKDGAPLLLLDGVGNPHNFGAIARTAAFFGIPRILLSDHPAQAGISDATYRIAEGGLEYIDVYRAAKFSAALRQLGEFYHVIGTALGDHTPLPSLKNKGKPVAVVMGNEEEGLPEASLAACGELVTIPGSGHVQSLNVAATTAILLYAVSFP